MTDPAAGRPSPKGALSGEEKSAFERRLSNLDDKLDEAKRRDAPRDEEGDRGAALSLAFRMATDLVAGVLVGGAIGYFIDRWLGWAPVMMLLFGVLGFVAGLTNVLRLHKRMQAESDRKYGPASAAPSVPDDDED